MVGLATHDLEPDLLDMLALVADPHTVLRKEFADAFREACYLEHLAADDGLINPNKVRARLLDHPSYRPRQYSGLWSSSYLAKTDIEVQISGEGSDGNTNKDVFKRRWLGDCGAHDHTEEPLS